MPKMPKVGDDTLLPVTELMQELRRRGLRVPHRNSMLNLIADGRIPGIKAGHMYVVRAIDLPRIERVIRTFTARTAA